MGSFFFELRIITKQNYNYNEELTAKKNAIMQCQILDLCKVYDVYLCLLIPKVQVITKLKTLLDLFLKGFCF